MAEDLRLSAQDIYDKEFHVEDHGYSPAEVDTLLDQVIEDYQTYDDKIRELGKALLRYEECMKELEAANAALQAKLEKAAEEGEKAALALQKAQADAEKNQIKAEEQSAETAALSDQNAGEARSRLEDELVRRVERLEQAVFASPVKA